MKLTLIGSRLLFNIIIIYTAANRNPEFLGYKGKPFPGQLPPRKVEIQPRRLTFPVGFYDDWKKIGSKRKKFDGLGLPLQKRQQQEIVPVEINSIIFG